MKFSIRAPRVLDFDCEARPLSWISEDYTSREITGIAWKFIGAREPLMVRILGEVSLADMLMDFCSAYATADIVTAHNAIRYDLPLVNSALLELGLPGLGPKLVSDTYLHLKKRSGISASQESLAATLGIRSPKVGMGQVAWRAANRLSPEGLEKTRARVIGDVKQHIQLRAKLIELDWLGPPRIWRP